MNPLCRISSLVLVLISATGLAQSWPLYRGPDEIWFKPNQLMNHWSTPVIRDGHLYGLYEFKKYGKAPLQCVELATGKCWSTPAYAMGRVYIRSTQESACIEIN